jgi:hypothetical protein
MQMKKNLLLFFIALFIGISACEIYLRVDGYRPWVRTTPGQLESERPEGHWFVVDEEFGWTYSRSATLGANPETDASQVTYDGNQEGFRDRNWVTLEDIQNEDPNLKQVLVFGDSQTAGHGVHERARFSNVLQDLLDEEHRVYNFAVAGWGFDQIYLAFRKYVPIIQPEVVVVSYIHNDLVRALEAYKRPENVDKPSFRVKSGKLYRRRPGERLPLWEQVFNRVYVLNIFYKAFGKPFLAHRLAETMTQDMVALAHEFGTKVIFVHVPSKKDVVPLRKKKDEAKRAQRALYNRYLGLESFFENRSEAFISPTHKMREVLLDGTVDFHLPDSHLNPAGHRFIGELIFEEVKKL